MGLSETILAAMIGAIATVSTALFQLFHALRNNKNDSRPKRGSPIRSLLSVMMLMIASAAGGFLYSELLKQRASQDMQAMREELNGKLQALAVSTEKLAAAREIARADQTVIAANASPVPLAQSTSAVTPVTSPSPATLMTESSIYAPACVVAGGCTEAARQSMLLCGAIPSDAQVKKADLYLRDARAPANTETQVALEQEWSGAKFSGTFTEQPADDSKLARKTICINLLHWSDQPHIARLVLYYGVSDAEPAPAKPLTIATQSGIPTTAASLATSAITR